MVHCSDVSPQRRRTEHLRADRAMCALIIMNFSDMLCQVVAEYFFFTARALLLDSRVVHLHVLRKRRSSYLLLALRALSCVAHVSFPDMAFYLSRANHLVAISALLLRPMDAFDVLGETSRWTEPFAALRTLV